MLRIIVTYVTNVNFSLWCRLVDNITADIYFNNSLRHELWHLINSRFKDKLLADLDNLPDPDVLANDIIENMEAGLESFRAIMAALSKK